MKEDTPYPYFTFINEENGEITCCKKYRIPAEVVFDKKKFIMDEIYMKGFILLEVVVMPDKSIDIKCERTVVKKENNDV